MPHCSAQLETPDKPLVFMHWGKAGGGSVSAVLERATHAMGVSCVQLHGAFVGGLRWNHTWTIGLADTGMNVAGPRTEAGVASRYYASARNSVFAWPRRDASSMLTMIAHFPGSPLVAWLRDPVSRYLSAWRERARMAEQAGGAKRTGAELGDELHADATSWPKHHDHAIEDVAFYLLGADPLNSTTNPHCTPGTDPQGEDRRKAK